jgi:hypothetical protein
MTEIITGTTVGAKRNRISMNYFLKTLFFFIPTLFFVIIRGNEKGFDQKLIFIKEDIYELRKKKFPKEAATVDF